MSLQHPEFIIAVDRLAVELIDEAGAFTARAVRHGLPFTGYSVEEVVAVLDVLVKRGHLATITDGPLVVYVGAPRWAGGS